MKQFRRWRRIFILSLLSISVLAPLVIMPRLRTLSLEGKKGAVEDLSSIKYRADTLKLSAIEQNEANGVKEPNPNVYRDQNHTSTTTYSDTQRLNNEVFDNDSSGTTTSTTGFRRKGIFHNVTEGGSSRIQHKEVLSANSQKIRQTNGVDSQHGRRLLPSPAKRNQHGDDPQSQKSKALDERVKRMKDQLVRAKVYLNFATTAGSIHLVKELKLRIKEVERALGEARKDSDLSKSAPSRMRHMEVALSKASKTYSECSEMVKKLRAMAQNAEEQVRAHRGQTAFLTRLAGRTTPKGLHCLSMRMTTDYFALQPEEREPHNQESFSDPNLFHYVIFSDNILASAVVINSTVSASTEPEKIVFHVVTDPLNFPGISMWFLLNPPGNASIQVHNMADFKQLSDKYDSSLEMQDFTDPRFSSPLNHLRFYLPEIFPKLDKVLFLDHDVVVQKDTMALWHMDMKGKVNGAVQTCQGDLLHHRMDMLINFSDPWVAGMFDADSCTWAFGVNLFDLREWRNQDLTSKYHRFLLMGQERPLWKPGSLPLGWVTFYNHTLPLPRQWHIPGLGYESGVSSESIEKAVIVHYEGIMKPWLDIGMRSYKGYWARYVDFDNPYLQRCNIHI